MHNYLFVDVESTGLPRKDHNWRTDYRLFPRIVSIAWAFKGQSKYFIINQRGQHIPDSATRVHGITDAMCEMSEHHIQVVMKELIADSLLAERIIGYNLYFDSSLIKACVLREFGDTSKEAELIDNGFDKMKRRDVMRMCATYNHGYMKLDKFYRKMFGESFPAHNASEDVKALQRCFIELVSQNIIKP